MLLIVAPNERRVRVEVGYRPEGALTDALSTVIITNAIAPRFKTGDFGGGISRGVDDIITVLTTDASEWQKRPSLRLDNVKTVGVPHLVDRCPSDWGGYYSPLRFARLPLVGLERGPEHPLSIQVVPGWQRRIFDRRRWIFGRRRLVRWWWRIRELVMIFSAEDRQQISGAIRAAEAKTSGEIVCVLAHSSATATALPVVVAAMAALVLPWALVTFTATPVYQRSFSLQVLAFLILIGILCWPPIRVALMPRSVRRSEAHRAAMEQFRLRGIASKKERTGILIFVSLAERYARIIADEGISARVPQSQWQAAVDALFRIRAMAALLPASSRQSICAGTNFPSTSLALRQGAMNCPIGST